MFLWKRIALPFFQVCIFFLIYYYLGNWILQYLVEPAILKLPLDLRIGLHPFLELDYGRITGRIFGFVWTLLLFFLFTRCVQRSPLKKSILFEPRPEWRTFFKGALFGAFLITSLIILSIATGVVRIRAIHLFFYDVVETIGLYIFCMALTAIAEEIAMRGIILQTLKNNWGTHWAVWISALCFGLIHLSESYYYAYTTFVAGLLLGYGYVWYGIYWCIGWHFMWNFLESIFYSGKIVIYEVNDPFLVGDKAMSPDQEGFLVLPILLIGFALMLAVHKTEWRLSEKT